MTITTPLGLIVVVFLVIFALYGIITLCQRIDEMGDRRAKAKREAAAAAEKRLKDIESSLDHLFRLFNESLSLNQGQVYRRIRETNDAVTKLSNRMGRVESRLNDAVSELARVGAAVASAARDEEAVTTVQPTGVYA